jgi:hypothetical protein
MTERIDTSAIGKGLFRWTGSRFEPAAPPAWYVRACTDTESSDWPPVCCSIFARYGEPDLLAIEVYETPDGDRYVLAGDALATIWEALVAPADWPHFFRDELLPLITAAMRMGTKWQMERLAEAAIGIGRHGLETDLDEITGQSRRDQWAQRQRNRQARERRA